MTIAVIEDRATALAEYTGIPIVFEFREVLDVIAEADGRGCRT